MYYNVTEARSSNRCRRGKAAGITYSGCMFVALLIQNAKRMRRIILPSVTCPALSYFSTFSHAARHDIGGGGGGTKHNMCFDFLYDFNTFLILRRTERDIIINVPILVRF
jgi:hypothetical protein